MAVTHLGTLPQTQAEGYTLTQDEMGGGEAVVTKTYKASTFTLANIPAPLSPHPSWPSLLLYAVEAARINGDLMEVKATYKGVILSNPRVYMVEEAEAQTNSEPIESNPMFYNEKGISRVTPKEITEINLALDASQNYDDKNLFPDATADGRILWLAKLHGITSWLRVGTQYSQTYISSAPPTDFASVGKIDTPRGGSPPRGGGDQNYLNAGISWRKEGGRVTITNKYLLSGPLGWSEKLYRGKSRGNFDQKPGTGGLVSGDIGKGIV